MYTTSLLARRYQFIIICLAFISFSCLEHFYLLLIMNFLNSSFKFSISFNTSLLGNMILLHPTSPVEFKSVDQITNLFHLTGGLSLFVMSTKGHRSNRQGRASRKLNPNSFVRKIEKDIKSRCGLYQNG